MRNKMTKKMPICWKCASAVIVPNDDSKSHGLESCKEEPKIKDYQDAENMPGIASVYYNFGITYLMQENWEKAEISL